MNLEQVLMYIEDKRAKLDKQGKILTLGLLIEEIHKDIEEIKFDHLKGDADDANRE